MKKLKLYKPDLIIDGNGGKPIENGFLLVEDNKIIKIGKSVDLNLDNQVEIIELRGKTIMPGVIDSHVHITIDPDPDFTGFLGRDSYTKIVLRGLKNLKKTLDGGVTYFRDLGGYEFIDIELNKCLKEGLIDGPDFLASGKMITMTGGHGWSIGRECDGVSEVRKAAREQIKAGADIVKIMATGGNLTKGTKPGAAQLTEEEIRAAVEEAHKAGKKTTTHAHGAEGIKNAILAGIDCIEHGMYIDDEALEMMAEKGVYYVPTLYAPWICAEIGEEGGLDLEAVKKTKESTARHMESFKNAIKHNVKIGMGTDAGTPFCEHGNGYVGEMKLMVKGGYTPMEAIVAATKVSSEILGINEKYGTLEEGKIADFIVLDENPLNNLDILYNIRNVYKNGVKVK